MEKRTYHSNELVIPTNDKVGTRIKSKLACFTMRAKCILENIATIKMFK